MLVGCRWIIHSSTQRYSHCNKSTRTLQWTLPLETLTIFLMIFCYRRHRRSCGHLRLCWSIGSSILHTSASPHILVHKNFIHASFLIIKMQFEIVRGPARMKVIEMKFRLPRGIVRDCGFLCAHLAEGRDGEEILSTCTRAMAEWCEWCAPAMYARCILWIENESLQSTNQQSIDRTEKHSLIALLAYKLRKSLRLSISHLLTAKHAPNIFWLLCILQAHARVLVETEEHGKLILWSILNCQLFHFAKCVSVHGKVFRNNIQKFNLIAPEMFITFQQSLQFSINNSQH